MPSSLSAGLSRTYWRIAKKLTILSGADLRIVSGGKQTNDAGSTTVYARTATLRLTPGANPGTCTAGDIGVDGSNRVVVCTGSNTWTVAGTQT